MIWVKRAVQQLIVSGLFAIVALAIGLAGRAWAANGVIEINQAKVNAAGGFPYVISAPGTYQLTGNLTVAAGNTDGIDITATSGEVAIQFNYFAITGPGADAGVGVRSTGSNTIVALSNGGVTGFSNGIQLAGLAVLTNMGASGNSAVGMVLNNGGNLGNGCGSFDNGSDGIQDNNNASIGITSTGTYVFDNGGNGINVSSTILFFYNGGAEGNGLAGIYAPTNGNIIENSNIQGNRGAGIVTQGSQIVGNLIMSNGVSGIALPVGGTLANGCWTNRLYYNDASDIASGACGPTATNANACGSGATGCP